MFRDYFDEALRDVQSALSAAPHLTRSQTERVLARAEEHPLSLHDAAALLRLHDAPEGDDAIALVHESVARRFRTNGRTVREIAPIYLTSHCIDRCGFCIYAQQNGPEKIARIRLTPEEIVEEVGAVAGEGSLVVEFTLGTDEEFRQDRLIDAIDIAQRQVGHRAGSGILLCSDHFDTATYATFARHGLRGMVQWDETLDRDKYKRWVGTSPHKKDFDARMNTHDHAMRAGLQVATGILFGLSDDFAVDTLLQILKARYLRREYGYAPFAFGTARVKPTGPRENAPAGLDDREYDLALAVYKLAEPSIARWLQTREEFEPNLRRMVDGDCFTYRCGGVTPGGHRVYANRDQIKHGQFRVNELTRDQFEDGLKRERFRVDYGWMR